MYIQLSYFGIFVLTMKSSIIILLTEKKMSTDKMKSFKLTFHYRCRHVIRLFMIYVRMTGVER